MLDAMAAIGIGAGWWDFTRDFWRPTLPFRNGDRIVTVEMRDAVGSRDESRIAHDFLGWRRDARTLQELTAYRTVERNMVIGNAGLERITVAEVTASMFRAIQVPPVLGRPLLDSDEQPGAAPVYDRFARTRGWWPSAITRQGDDLFVSTGYWGVQKIGLR